MARSVRTAAHTLRTDDRSRLLAADAARDEALARVAVLTALVPTLWLLGRTLDRDQLLHGFGPAAMLPGWLQAVFVVVIGDFVGYWMHRAFHSGGLWSFHAVHHDARELTWLSAVRVHPLNDALMRIGQAIPFVALGFSPVLIGGYLPFFDFLRDHAARKSAMGFWSAALSPREPDLPSLAPRGRPSCARQKLRGSCAPLGSAGRNVLLTAR